MLEPAPAGFDHPPPLVEFSQRGRIGHHGTHGPVDISFVAFAGLAAVVLVAAGGIRAKVTRSIYSCPLVVTGNPNPDAESTGRTVEFTRNELEKGIPMIEATAAVGVAAIALGMVLTPGPNMVHLTSSAIGQGRRAGLVSLSGTAVGFCCYLLMAVAGLSAVFTAILTAFTVVKLAGAAYLAYLAWGMLRPGGRAIFSPQQVAPVTDRRLFGMGLLTNLLNPKIALMYAALLPQFVSLGAGPTWTQLLQLGAIQICVAVTINAMIVLGAAGIAEFLATRPRVMTVQRWAAGTLLGVFAIRTALSEGPAST